jgi:phage terminase large subunit-like protein
VGCQILEDGRIAVGLLQTWKSDTAIDEATIIPDIGQWVKTYRPRVLAFDRWTGSGVAQGLAAVGVPVGDVSGANFVQACDQFLMAMNGKRMAHTSQVDLNLHVNACARKPAADGGWRVVRKHSSNDISAAIAAIMCVYHALAPQQTAVIAFG